MNEPSGELQKTGEAVDVNPSADSQANSNMMLTRVHIRNIKSIKEATVELTDKSFIFGPNNSGKSNLLFAIDCALGNQRIQRDDVYSDREEPYSKDKPVVVDLLFTPIVGDELGEWSNTIGPLIHDMEVDDRVVESFAFRTEFRYDEDNDSYRKRRLEISSWDEAGITVGKSGQLREDVMSHFHCYLIDAHRDISEDIHDRGSLWNREVSKLDIPSELAEVVIEKLASMNKEIIGRSELLDQISKALLGINVHESVILDPLPSEVRDVYRGLDIKMDGEGGKIPISSAGLGTRSLAVIKTAEILANRKREGPQYSLLMMEEPEAHLHPQYQSDIGRELVRMKGQVIITTHSPYVLAESSITNSIYCHHDVNGTEYRSFPKEAGRIDRIDEVLNRFRPSFPFSNVVVLAEGRTEELFLPLLIEAYFEKPPSILGITVTSVGGTNYKRCLEVLDAYDMPWIIFSDGEPKALKNLHDNIPECESLMEGDGKRILYLPDGMNIETYLCRNICDDVSEFLQGFRDNYQSELDSGKEKRKTVEKTNIRVLESCKTEYPRPLAEYICKNNLLSRLPIINELMEMLEQRIS